MPKYQTLQDFLRTPFGSTSSNPNLAKYNSSYLANKNKIILNGLTKIEDSFYYHIKIPSESQKDGNVYYDVVIRFFTDKPSVKLSSSLREYYIQFFSNSPSFIYNYAVLYKNNGFLIDTLYTKLDPRYFDKLPTKTNSKLELSYDKSIYLACRFLNENTFKVLNKVGAVFTKKIRPNEFFKEIKDFQTIQIENELLSLEKKAIKDFDKSLNKEEEKKKIEAKQALDTHRKTASNSTTKDKRNPRVVKKTSTNATSLVKSIIKKTAGKSTRKKQP